VSTRTDFMLWKEDGLCRTANGNWVDVPNVGSQRRQRELMRSELAICQVCPVRRQCLIHALEFHEHHGIWGGRLPKERRRISRIIERRRP
jgi:WhiB family redox-sensing transcriptional regulator